MKKFYITLMATVLLSHIAFSQNLVASYDFTNGSAQDNSGNGLNGIIHGGITATTGATGVANTAVSFNGINGYIAIPPNALLNLTKWTLHAVIKVDTFNSGWCQGNAIVWKGYQGASQHYHIGFFDNFYDNSCTVYSPPHDIFYSGAAGSSSNSLVNAANVQTHYWYCVTATFDSGIVKLYIDGALQQSLNFPTTYNYSLADTLYIGCSDQGVPDDIFAGSIDQVKIWDGAIPYSRISSICDSAKLNTEGPNTTSIAGVSTPIHGAVYPNPATDILNVSVLGGSIPVSIKVMSVSGQVVFSSSTQYTTGQQTLQLPISTLVKGVYMLFIHDNTGSRKVLFNKN